MPLTYFLGLVVTVILAAGLTIWAAAGFGLSLGVLGAVALLAALAIRAFAWP